MNASCHYYCWETVGHENNLSKSEPSISVFLWAKWEGRIIYKEKPKGFSDQGYEPKSLSDCVSCANLMVFEGPMATSPASGLCLFSCLAMTTTSEQRGRGHWELGLLQPILSPMLFLTSQFIHPWAGLELVLPRHWELEPGALDRETGSC